MNFAALERIADAVLYEGYILYPYRPSSLKNRQRWNFGTLYPRSFADRQSPPEAYSFHAEVLLTGTHESRVNARVRFLQLVAGEGHDPQAWNEGFARSGEVSEMSVGGLGAAVEQAFEFSSVSEEERQASHAVPMVGHLVLRAEPLRDGLWRLKVDFSNETHMPDADRASRKDAHMRACVSAHLLLGIEEGECVSLLDPGPQYHADTAACVNQGVFPVLVGERGDRSQILCSPIILYDYPQIAPESAGDFFDGTEMDEMLALRVLTLTDEEKAEMRKSDPHGAAILARMETMPADHMLKLHGAVRGMRPASTEPKDEIEGRIEPWNPFEERPRLESVRVFGMDVRCGDRVRLWPRKKADILDIAMNGKVAIIEAIEQDLEDKVQLAVVLEDDPGKDMGLLRQAGHRFFFSPEEIEPLGMEVR